MKFYCNYKHKFYHYCILIHKAMQGANKHFRNTKMTGFYTREYSSFLVGLPSNHLPKGVIGKEM
jgi:hypothetical protein